MNCIKMINGSTIQKLHPESEFEMAKNYIQKVNGVKFEIANYDPLYAMFSIEDLEEDSNLATPQQVYEVDVVELAELDYRVIDECGDIFLFIAK